MPASEVQGRLKKGRHITAAWDCIQDGHGDQGSEYHNALRTVHERYRMLYEDQQRKQADQSYIEGISTAIARMPLATRLEIDESSSSRFDRGSSDKAFLRWIESTESLVRGMLAPVTWREARDCDLECPTSDILINLAGLYESTKFGNIDHEEILKAFAVNTVPAFLLMQMVGPEMAKRQRGRIVNVGSIGTKFGGGADSFCYSLSKHALEFMPSAVKRWAKDNVLVNTLRVGVTRTRFHDTNKDMAKRVELIPAKQDLLLLDGLCLELIFSWRIAIYEDRLLEKNQDQVDEIFARN